MTPLCVAPRCAIGGRHQTGCPEPDCAKPQHDTACCRGCLPRQAADGLRLCHVCTTRLAEDAEQAAVLHAELAERLGVGTGMGERVTGGSDTHRAVNAAAVETRADIEHFLTWWAALIVRERGITRPAYTATALGAFIAQHSRWLAAHRYASYAATELHDIARGRAWSVAYPGSSGTRVRELPKEFRCPKCTGALRAVMRAGDSLLPAEVACDNPEPHVWPAARWRELDRLVTRSAA
jgi:hypothetical protein